MNVILICLGASYVAAAIPGTLLVLYLIQRFYLRTSRQMRLLDLESKSPLIQHFTETIEGHETIRAFGWQEFYNRAALARLDVSQKPYYLLYCIQRWLNFVLDCVVGVLAVVLVAIALSVPQSSSGGALGVALTSVLMFNTSLKQMITNFTQAETSLGSISRTAAFERDTPSEDSLDENIDPGPDWPSSGEVNISSMGVVYRFVDKLTACSVKIASHPL
jgi:ATP-binding cassette, subfamily C (CFTR/MRP), member 1